MEIPKSHPRYESLTCRHKLVSGLDAGFVAKAGLIAHGRGEAFDYLIGEKTTKSAELAERVAVAKLLLAINPVISVNGNVAALVPDEIVNLSKLLGAKLEVNLFYRTPEREQKIKEILINAGAGEVFGAGEIRGKIPGLDSERSRVDPAGIFTADVVMVPLEDGDRAEALAKMGKEVIAIDLNPLSRTSKAACITIVDNIIRAVPNMIKLAGEMKKLDKRELKKLIKEFDNDKNIDDGLKEMCKKFK
jgi:4-phosphopantoate--beta-alanine ligase